MQLSLFEQTLLGETDKRTNILLSLRDEYFQKILDGTKKYEYRFAFPKSSVRAYIYIPQKVKAIAGYIDLEKPISGSAEEIAFIYESSGDGPYDIMLDYIGSRKIAYAMKIENIITFAHPISYKALKKVFPEFYAPQSYIILDKNQALLEYVTACI